MTSIKLSSYAINLLACLATIGIGVWSMNAFSLAAIGFLVWAISPYLFAAFLTERSTHRIEMLIVTGLSLIIATGGVFLLITAMYFQADAQSALAFIAIPAYQWVMLLVTAIPIYLVNRKHR